MSQVSSTNSSTSTTMHQGSQFDSSPATDPHSSNVAVTPVVSELPAAKQPAATTMPATAGASNATSTNQRAQPSQNPIQKAVDTNSGKLLLRVAGQNDTCLSQFLPILKREGYKLTPMFCHPVLVVFTYGLCYGHMKCFWKKRQSHLGKYAGISPPPIASQGKNTL